MGVDAVDGIPDDLPAFTGSAGRPQHSARHPAQIASRFFDAGLKFAAQCTTAVREKQITGQSADDSAYDRCGDHL